MFSSNVQGCVCSCRDSHCDLCSPREYCPASHIGQPLHPTISSSLENLAAEASYLFTWGHYWWLYRHATPYISHATSNVTIVWVYLGLQHSEGLIFLLIVSTLPVGFFFTVEFRCQVVQDTWDTAAAQDSSWSSMHSISTNCVWIDLCPNSMYTTLRQPSL